jgi:hypothetical protein
MVVLVDLSCHLPLRGARHKFPRITHILSPYVSPDACRLTRIALNRRLCPLKSRGGSDNHA